MSLLKSDSAEPVSFKNEMLRRSISGSTVQMGE